MNVYKVTTGYDGTQNFDSYHVLAENGMSAMAKINTKVYNKRRKKQEVVEEVEFVASITE